MPATNHHQQQHQHTVLQLPQHQSLYADLPPAPLTTTATATTAQSVTINNPSNTPTTTTTKGSLFVVGLSPPVRTSNVKGGGAGGGVEEGSIQQRVLISPQSGTTTTTTTTPHYHIHYLEVHTSLVDLKASLVGPPPPSPSPVTTATYSTTLSSPPPSSVGTTSCNVQSSCGACISSSSIPSVECHPRWEELSSSTLLEGVSTTSSPTYIAEMNAIHLPVSFPSSFGGDAMRAKNGNDDLPQPLPPRSAAITKGVSRWVAMCHKGYCHELSRVNEEEHEARKDMHLCESNGGLIASVGGQSASSSSSSIFPVGNTKRGSADGGSGGLFRLMSSVVTVVGGSSDINGVPNPSSDQSNDDANEDVLLNEMVSGTSPLDANDDGRGSGLVVSDEHRVAGQLSFDASSASSSSSSSSYCCKTVASSLHPHYVQQQHVCRKRREFRHRDAFPIMTRLIHPPPHTSTQASSQKSIQVTANKGGDADDEDGENQALLSSLTIHPPCSDGILLGEGNVVCGVTPLYINPLCSPSPRITTTATTNGGCGGVRKMLLALDLDETMSHALRPPPGHPAPLQWVPSSYDAKLVVYATTEKRRGGNSTINRDGDRRSSSLTTTPVITATKEMIYVKYRPNLRAFLSALSPLFQIAIFTASRQLYADALLDVMDPSGRAFPKNHRYYRQHCTSVINRPNVEVAPGGDVDPRSATFRAKDLRVFGRPLDEVVLLDNTISCGYLQPRNLLPIPTWTGDPSDTALLRLIPVLTAIAKSRDVYGTLDRHLGPHAVTPLYTPKEVSGLTL